MADTIYALSSGGLPSGVAVIRLSGPESWLIAKKLVGDLPEPGFLKLANMRDPSNDAVLDKGMLVCFQAPKSFTGEDVVELHCHGSRATVQAIFRVLDGFENCRMAEAGEFSRRGFENGKFDLTEIEGLSDLIAAETEAQRVLALRQSGGELRSLFEGWREGLIRSRALTEAELDFSDEEDVPGGVSDQVWSEISRLHVDIACHLDDGRAGEIVRDGYRIVLAGPPNAGKSSLLNALARRDVAIVTPEAGTTRDVIDVSIDLDGFKVTLSDTAGIRRTDNVVEREGISRATRAMQQADKVLWLQPVDQDEDKDRPENAVLVRSKSDLPGAEAAGVGLFVNTVAENGLDGLLSYLKQELINYTGGFESSISTRQRHRRALMAVQGCLLESLDGSREIELRSEHLRRAAEHLGRITGRIDVEDLLDVIFSEFCVGK